MSGQGRGVTEVPEVPEAEVHQELEHKDDGETGPVYLRSPSEAIQPEPVPPPPDVLKPERNRLFTVFNGFISLTLFVLVVTAAVVLVVKAQFEAPGPLRQARAVLIPKGETLSAIAARLQREGVIADGYIFIAGVWASKTGSQLKAGEYLFKEQDSMRDVMATLVEGKAILHKVTIPEGWTSQQVVAHLNEEPLLTGTIDGVPEEGSLLPDTYKFTRGAPRRVILERMQRAHKTALARVWARRDKDLPVKSPKELVILASIVEKETGKADERPRVAAVFSNRLKKSMRLQSDPTIIYGITGGKAPLGRAILKSEIEQPTPYNTYRVDGLPPTPIANPGIAALEATANPSRTEDLYFVADGTGGHVFAKTLNEHNQNVARWREIQQAAREAEEAAKAEAEKVENEAPKAGASAVPKLDLRVPTR